MHQLNSESLKSFCAEYRKGEKGGVGRTLKTPANYSTFCKTLCETICKSSRPSDLFLQSLYNRFKSSTSDNRLDVLDFMLTMTLLARIVYETKLHLLFQLCDDDEDDRMSFDDVLDMLQRIEIIFAQEGKSKVESAILDHFIAKRKATLNFQMIMGMFNHQNGRPPVRVEQITDTETVNTVNTLNSGKTLLTRDESNISITQADGDSRITFTQYMGAIQNLKSLYKTLLPRQLSFKEVLFDNFSGKQIDDFYNQNKDIVSKYKEKQFEDNYQETFTLSAPKMVFDREKKLLKFADGSQETRQKKIDETKKLYGLFKIQMDYVDANQLDIEQIYIDNSAQ